MYQPVSIITQNPVVFGGLPIRLVTIPPVRGQAANRQTGGSEFKFRGRALSQCDVM